MNPSENISFDAAMEFEFEIPAAFGGGKGKGMIRAQIIRKDGTIEDVGWSQNGITNEGFNDMLGVYFHGDTQNSSWYALLVSTSSYSALAAADTMASHTGWTESTAYSDSTRRQITFNAAASKSIANTTTADFNISTDGTVIKGIGVTSNNTKSGTTGKLWATGLFASDQTLNNGDVLKITYQMNLA